MTKSKKLALYELGGGEKARAGGAELTAHGLCSSACMACKRFPRSVRSRGAFPGIGSEHVPASQAATSSESPFFHCSDGYVFTVETGHVPLLFTTALCSRGSNIQARLGTPCAGISWSHIQYVVEHSIPASPIPVVLYHCLFAVGGGPHHPPIPLEGSWREAFLPSFQQSRIPAV